ncbi:hypothetical protein PR048_021899 [Dryococelus australis]|uniref:Uncharacterized protein n=1 Tax=Dryococelus australis TaxID=614101 RepID=A0ABQ9GZH4_9NEOP|nr:hypothetical protein PR048_021899 [Dryococelus australis]
MHQGFSQIRHIPRLTSSQATLCNEQSTKLIDPTKCLKSLTPQGRHEAFLVPGMMQQTIHTFPAYYPAANCKTTTFSCFNFSNCHFTSPGLYTPSAWGMYKPLRGLLSSHSAIIVKSRGAPQNEDDLAKVILEETLALTRARSTLALSFGKRLDSATWEDRRSHLEPAKYLSGRFDELQWGVELMEVGKEITYKAELGEQKSGI